MNHRLTALLLCTAPLAAQQYVHLDAQINCPNSPVTITLPAGCWRITPVGPAADGQYTAWHPWNGTNASCNATGLGCSQGWATLSLSGTTDSAGDSALPIPLPCDPALLCGIRLTCQAVVLDAAATGDLAFSNGIDFTVGS